MDYLVPTAMELPAIETVHLEYPSPRNPLGIKGIGEGGAISPPAAIANAIDDALAPFGVRVTRTPLGPSRVLALIAEGAARPPAAEGSRVKPAPFEYHAAPERGRGGGACWRATATTPRCWPAVRASCRC